MPRIVFMDLESRPCPAMGPYLDRKGRPAVDKDGEPAFAPAPFHEVVMVGVCVLRLRDDKHPADAFEALDVIDREDEAETIRVFIKRQEKARPRLVTWNGRGFDLPALQARAMRHLLPFPWSFQVGKRYATGQHMDLADVVTNFGAASRTPALDHYARLVGWPGKLDDSGANVEQLLADGKRSWLRVYCSSDTILTAAVWLRHMHVSGAWPIERYRPAAESLLALARSRPELAPWAGRVDESVWLGAPLPVEEPASSPAGESGPPEVAA